MIRSTSAFADSKQHFLILDALRGIAAVMVVMMHGFEIFCGGNYHEMIINHGYLAVDFFFMLSGYVMAHAYDDRWDRMTIGQFFKRRLIRLHPLIIVGTVLGALLFYFQASSVFPNIEHTPVREMLLIMLIGLFMIPVPISMDIRGWNEMFPLNGPAWSLFLEYIANLLHALVLRKLSRSVLSVLVMFAAIALIHRATQGKSGDLIGGWSIEPEQFRFGLTRLLFPYMAGMLLRRALPPNPGKNTFLLASALLVLVLSIPRIGGNERLWLNGLYESFVIILVFPLVIYLGAIGTVKGAIANRICVFMGDISYPLYITHFPLMCLFYAWVVNNSIPLSTGIWAILLLTLVSIGLAYLWLKLYDEPVRKWLTRRFLN